jgi:hypothetical protein
MSFAKTEIILRICAKEKNTNNISEVAIAERDKSRNKMKKAAQTMSVNRREGYFSTLSLISKGEALI